MDYPKGSEWRKWDLHVHTPCSALNNQFHGNGEGESAWEAYISALEAVRDVAVLGATDYFSIEGYKKILEYRREGSLAKFDLVLPNIELRLDTFIGDKKKRDINFHVIFSDDIHTEVIEKEFLEALTIVVSGSTSGLEGKRQLTRRAIEDVGKLVNTNQPDSGRRSDFEVGVANITVSLEDVQALLRKDLFSGKYLLVLAGGEWNDLDWKQAYLAKKNFLQSAHFLEASSPNTVNWSRGERDLSVDDLIREFGCLKPCIRGSDAHSIETICNPADGRPCWIKADPTFEGLRQVTNEPLSRVFIGETPPELARKDLDKTKYIDSIHFRKKGNANLQEEWFGEELGIPLNSGLVAIIGRKGSGKSALADTIALLGDVPVTDSFSFLNRHKFRNPSDNKSLHFEAELRWASGGPSGFQGLEADAHKEKPLSVKYIPQNYLEEICNELGDGKDGGFTDELEEVVFSHVDMARRLRRSTLRELIDYSTSEIQRDLDFTRERLQDTNRQIMAVTTRLHPSYRSKMNNLLLEKKRQLDSHIAVKPQEVKKPVIEDSVQDELDLLNVNLEQLNTRISGIKTEQKRMVETQAVIDRVLERIGNFERTFQRFKQESEQDLAVLEITFDEVVTLHLDTQKIETARTKTNVEINRLIGLLNPTVDGSVSHGKLRIEERLKELSLSINVESRRYQEFLKSVREWEGKRVELEGDDETPETLKYFEKQLKDIEQLPMDLDRLETEREHLTRQAFATKEKLAAVYKELYAPVQDFIQSQAPALGAIALEFNVYMACEGFEEGFLEYINQKKLGSFQGIEEGRKILRAILETADLNSVEGVLSFISSVLNHLKEDKQKLEPRTDAEQLLSKYSVNDLWDFLFSLDYLEPKYRLMWSGRTIEQLSPGERGTLLLLFYLLIDKRDIPLVIDQPEENLDNQTVYEILVPCIKMARSRRQVIMVTHNPNLAVVCDADQVIHASIIREQGNKVTYISGAIENPTINRLIQNVLEGTRPAFDNRDSKYLD